MGTGAGGGQTDLSGLGCSHGRRVVCGCTGTSWHPEGHHSPHSKEECTSLTLCVHPSQTPPSPGSQPSRLCGSAHLSVHPAALLILPVFLCLPPSMFAWVPSSGPGCGADFLIPGNISNQNFQFLLDTESLSGAKLGCGSSGTSGCLHLQLHRFTCTLVALGPGQGLF